MGTRIVKKITMKELCGDVKSHVLRLVDKETGVIPDGVKIPLARIAGKVHSFEVRPGRDDFAPSIQLKGDFRAFSKLPLSKAQKDKGVEQQPTVISGTCYLPGSLPDMIAAGLKDSAGTVAFCADIDIVTEAKSVTGYIYNVEMPMEPQSDDSVGQLLGIGQNTAPALPPTAEKGSEPIPAPEETSPTASHSGKKK